jgi:hypothetical protein
MIIRSGVVEWMKTAWVTSGTVALKRDPKLRVDRTVELEGWHAVNRCGSFNRLTWMPLIRLDIAH